MLKYKNQLNVALLQLFIYSHPIAGNVRLPEMGSCYKCITYFKGCNLVRVQYCRTQHFTGGQCPTRTNQFLYGKTLYLVSYITVNSITNPIFKLDKLHSILWFE